MAAVAHVISVEWSRESKSGTYSSSDTGGKILALKGTNGPTELTIVQLDDGAVRQFSDNTQMDFTISLDGSNDFVLKEYEVSGYDPDEISVNDVKAPTRVWKFIKTGTTADVAPSSVSSVVFNSKDISISFV